MLAAFEISILIKNALPEILSWTLDLICLALAISFCLQSFWACQGQTTSALWEMFSKTMQGYHWESKWAKKEN